MRAAAAITAARRRTHLADRCQVLPVPDLFCRTTARTTFPLPLTAPFLLQPRWPLAPRITSPCRRSQILPARPVSSPTALEPRPPLLPVSQLHARSGIPSAALSRV